MQIYVANTTLQRYVFHYRDPVDHLLKNITIERGRQVVLPGSGRHWSAEEIESGSRDGKNRCLGIMAQLENAGAHDAAEVHAAIKAFQGLLYRINAPVAIEEIMLGAEEVKKMQRTRSVEQAVRGVFAADRSVNPEVGQRRARLVEIEIEQIVPPGERATGDEVHLHMSIDADNGSNDARGIPGILG